MHHVAVGSVLERVGQLNCHVERTAHVERPLRPHEVAQIRALDELEDDEVPAVFRADRMHTADVFVVEPGRRLRLVAKPPQHLLVGRLLPREDLHRHHAIEGGVERPENGTHPAAAHELLELIGPQAAAFEHAADLRHRQRPDRRLPGDHGGIGAGDL